MAKRKEIKFRDRAGDLMGRQNGMTFYIFKDSEDMKTAGKILEAWADVSITMEATAEGLRAFFCSLELAMAVHLARIFEPELVHRYRCTKKKRTRKKYEKRILAWFREVFR